MSRALGRWIVLGVLGAIVVGLGVATSYSNRKLVEDLAKGDADAFSIFSERQDAYIFLQSEPAPTRLRIAQSLAKWQNPASAKLSLLLIPDPDPQIRKALTVSLQEAARRNPANVAAEFGVTGAAESAALIEASSKEANVGLDVLGEVLKTDPASANGLLLAKRIGSRSEAILMPLLQHTDPMVRLASAETLASLGLDTEARQRVSSVLLEMYRQAEDVAFRDRLLPVLAGLAPKEGANVFSAVARDHTAPSDLRAIATRALAKLKDPIVGELARDADTVVAAAARNER